MCGRVPRSDRVSRALGYQRNGFDRVTRCGEAAEGDRVARLVV